MSGRTERTVDWLQSVVGDLKIARQQAGGTDPVVEAACFHCQQAAEKALKAWLIWRGTEPPQIHNLATLLDLCAETDPPFADLENAADLTAYAVAGRYPDTPIKPTFADLTEALGLAEAVAAFVGERLRAEGVDPGPLAGAP